MIERDKEYYNHKISELYAVIENQEKIIGDLQEKNESLKTRIKTVKRRRKKQTQKKYKYKYRIDEVREYLDNLSFDGYCDGEYVIRDLFRILEGDNDE